MSVKVKPDDLLKYTADRFKLIGSLREMSSGNTTVASKQLKTVISTALEPGIYIVSAYSEWANDIASAYCIYQISIGGATVALYRGYMVGGGGIPLTTIVKVESRTTIEYSLYNGHSSGVEARKISMDILQIVPGGGNRIKRIFSRFGRAVRI